MYRTAKTVARLWALSVVILFVWGLWRNIGTVPDGDECPPAFALAIMLYAASLPMVAVVGVRHAVFLLSGFYKVYKALPPN
jgi:hypothetical protein